MVWPNLMGVKVVLSCPVQPIQYLGGANLTLVLLLAFAAARWVSSSAAKLTAAWFYEGHRHHIATCLIPS